MHGLQIFLDCCWQRKPTMFRNFSPSVARRVAHLKVKVSLFSPVGHKPTDFLLTRLGRGLCHTCGPDTRSRR